jgi:polysaccharide biosynthesis/export protein
MLQHYTKSVITHLAIIILAPVLLVFNCWGQPDVQTQTPVEANADYVLGPEDQIAIRCIACEEISEKSMVIDASGFINMPLIGRVQVGGMTAHDLEKELNVRLKKYILDPQVSVLISEYRSQPVSVLGAVQRPGIQQLRGTRSLAEMLSLAGGITADAGYTVKVTRKAEMGKIDIPGAETDPSGRFITAEINLESILDAKNPEHNITVRPFDVITVPRGQMIYVMGEVRKPGGFVLRERESISVLQALALAEGTVVTAGGTARILRKTEGGAAKTEVVAKLRDLLAGTRPDIPLLPNDILLIPKSAAKNATLRAIETGIQLGTGVLIWRR